MTTSSQILDQINKISKKDSDYNNLQNEGAEGFEVDNVSDSLISAFAEAREQEFKNEWTLEVYNARLKTFRDAKLTNLLDLINFKKIHGYEKTEILKAADFLGITYK